MADFLDLNSRTSKLQKEQEKRREAARSRIQRERASKEAAARELARIEEQIRQRKREQARKEAEVSSLYSTVMTGQSLLSRTCWLLGLVCKVL